MSDMILGSAQGAVDSLLGRLTSVLVEEAQLLGGVRRDVQFIKDEMESMNGFLMHVAEASGDDDDGDHQVRAWMKQVAEVAYASQNSIDLYVQSLGGVGMGRRAPGFLGYLRRLPKLVWTLPRRHRIATQIQELKVRSCEVGERRLRYDVKAPERRDLPRTSAKSTSWQAVRGGDDDAKEQEDARRRALADADGMERHRDAVVKWLRDEQDGHGEEEKPRVMAITGAGGMGKTYLAHSFYKDPFAASWFDRKAWIKVELPFNKIEFLRNMLAQVADERLDLDGEEEVLVEKIQLHLEEKRFLLAIDDVWDSSVCDFTKSALFGGWNCSPGSAILLTARSPVVAQSFHSPDKYYFSHLHIGGIHGGDFLMKAISLLGSNKKGVDLKAILSEILGQLDSPLAMRLFLRDLYVNPNQNEECLQSLCDGLSSCDSTSEDKVREVLEHVFRKLPSDCENCLLYLSILPRDATFKRARLLRRWVAEDMITRRGRLGALDQAEHYFNLLVAHGLVMPTDIGVTGKVKKFEIHDSMVDILMGTAREKDFSNANLQPELASRLSIRNGVQLHATRYKACCWNICNQFDEIDQTQIDQYNATQVFLESLSSSTTYLGILEVLDLEDYKQLNNNHLKNICNHLFQLKYLSLRNTDITELPKQLDKLQYLETLDIRQTKVRAFAKNSVFLPKLQYLLAGHQTDPTNQGNNNSQETFFTVQMPKHVGVMTELQVLSHIAVSGSGNELSYIGNLLRLRKLGVVLNGCDEAVFRHLYHTIGNLSECLRSLSIRATALPSNENAGVDTLPLTPPKHLEQLEISGLENGLPPWIEKLGILTKITLHKTLLTTGEISILGQLASLCCLRLREETCSESTLTLKTEEFQCLKFLILECSGIRSINIGHGASPKLKKILWSSTEKQSLFGIEHLPELQEIELTEDMFELEKMEEEIDAHRNNPVLKQNNSMLIIRRGI